MYIYIYTRNGILLYHKKEWNFAICSNTDGLGGHYAKLKMLVNTTKKKQTHRYREQTCSYQFRGGERQWGVGVGEHKPLSVRYAQGCTVQHKEYSLYFVITINGK